MNLRYALQIRFVPKIYLLAQLLILIGFSLAFVPFSTIWLNLFITLSVAVSLELILNATRKKTIRLPDSASITAIIIVGVLAISTQPAIVAFIVAISILAKHFLRYKSRHLLNPANLGIFLAVFLLGQNTEWWVASNIYVIIFLGLFVMYKLRRFWTPLIFLAVYFILISITGPSITLDFVQTQLFANFSIYFFAFVMLPEPQTAAWTTKGRYVNAFLTALIAVILTLANIRTPLIVSLIIVNLFTPIVNKYTKVKRI